jgi:hypothetical protein
MASLAGSAAQATAERTYRVIAAVTCTDCATPGEALPLQTT